MSQGDSLRVLIAGAVPDEINRNVHSRQYLARGFRDLLADNLVKDVTFEYAAEAIASFLPDLVVIFGGCFPDICDYSAIKAAAIAHGAHLAFWLHDDPYEFDYHFRAAEFADTIFTNDRWALEHYHFRRVFHLPLAACPQAHYREIDRSARKRFDLLFVGAAFDNRIRMMRDIAACSSGPHLYVKGSGWPNGMVGCENELIANDALPDYYAQSVAVLNLGRDLDLGNERYRISASTPGPRTFEAAMAGCVQLFFVTGLEIEEYFDSGSEILLFDHAEEAVQLAESLANEPERAFTIAAASQRRALRDHSYSRRAKRILEVCLPDIAVDFRAGNLPDKANISLGA